MNIIQTKRAAMNVTTGVMSFILPQNGVMKGAVHYGRGDSSPQVAMAASIDAQPANGVSSEALKRPKQLGVNSAKPYAVKSLSDDSDGGSLPCTPELESEGSSCPAEYEELETDTRELIDRFLKEFTGLKQSRWHESEALSTMKRVVDSLLEKHKFAYNGMISKIGLDDRGVNDSLISAIAKNLFSDGTTNWGRIASLVAFGAVVSQYMVEKGRVSYVEHVGCEISTYLLMDQRDWLIKNNSWDGFVEFFRVADPESTVRNTLMACVGIAGIGATLALLIR